MTKIGKLFFLWTSLPSEFLPCFLGGASGNEPDCQCRRCERRARFLGREDPLEGMATHSSILAW